MTRCVTRVDSAATFNADATIKEVYEKAYGKTIGIMDVAAGGTATYKTGCSVVVVATDSRRASMKVQYSAIVSDASGVNQTAASKGVTDTDSFVSNVNSCIYGSVSAISADDITSVSPATIGATTGSDGRNYNLHLAAHTKGSNGKQTYWSCLGFQPIEQSIIWTDEASLIVQAPSELMRGQMIRMPFLTPNQTEFVVSVGQSSTIYVLYGEGTGSGGMENLLPAAGFTPISERIWLEHASTSSNYSLAIMQTDAGWGMITLPRTTTENAVLSIVIAWDDMQTGGSNVSSSGFGTAPMYSGSGSGSGSDTAPMYSGSGSGSYE